MTSRKDTPLAELLLAQGLVSRPVLAQALAQVREAPDPDQHLSLAVFLLQHRLVEPEVLERAREQLRPLGATAPPAPVHEGWGHMGTLEARAPSNHGAPRLGAYRLLRKLAEGGMGEVFEAEHCETGARYALKTIKSNAVESMTPDSLARLRREAQLSAEVDHPQVVRIHAADFAGPTPYIVQDLLAGGSLQWRVRRQGPLSAPEVVELGSFLAQGLSAAHARGILHRDLKPDNVLFNDRDQPVLVDFGLARRAGVNSIQLTQTGEILGTPAFMAPEQALDASRAGPPADVYALGALLYFALEGHPPFPGGTLIETLNLVVNEAPPRAPSAPPALGALLQVLMSKDPHARPSAAALPALLEASLRQGRFGSGFSKLGVAAALAALPLAGLGLWAALSTGSSSAPQASPVAAARPASSPSPAPEAPPSPSLAPALLRALAASIEDESHPLRARVLDAAELARHAPASPSAELARELLRTVREKPLVSLPSLQGHIGLTFSSPSVVFGATSHDVYTLDLRAKTLEWSPFRDPETRRRRRLSQLAILGGQAWLTLAQPRQGIYDLSSDDFGVIISPKPTWDLKPASHVSIALSPGGRWAVTGGSTDLVLYDLKTRRPRAFTRLPAQRDIYDAKVEFVQFMGDRHLVAILNQRASKPGVRLPYPLSGDAFVFEIEEKGALAQRGHYPLEEAGYGLATTEDAFFLSDKDSFRRHELAALDASPTLLEEGEGPHRLVAAIAAWSDARLYTARVFSESAKLDRSEFGRWDRREERWHYTPLGETSRGREVSFSPHRQFALGSCRQSSLEVETSGVLWFVGEVGP